MNVILNIFSLIFGFTVLTLQAYIYYVPENKRRESLRIKKQKE